jgi:hypothetical protein
MLMEFDIYLWIYLMFNLLFLFSANANPLPMLNLPGVQSTDWPYESFTGIAVSNPTNQLQNIFTVSTGKDFLITSAVTDCDLYVDGQMYIPSSSHILEQESYSAFVLGNAKAPVLSGQTVQVSDACSYILEGYYIQPGHDYQIFSGEVYGSQIYTDILTVPVGKSFILTTAVGADCTVWKNYQQLLEFNHIRWDGVYLSPFIVGNGHLRFEEGSILRLKNRGNYCNYTVLGFYINH